MTVHFMSEREPHFSGQSDPQESSIVYKTDAQGIDTNLLVLGPNGEASMVCVVARYKRNPSTSEIIRDEFGRPGIQFIPQGESVPHNLITRGNKDVSKAGYSLWEHNVQGYNQKRKLFKL